MRQLNAQKLSLIVINCQTVLPQLQGVLSIVFLKFMPGIRNTTIIHQVIHSFLLGTLIHGDHDPTKPWLKAALPNDWLKAPRSNQALAESRAARRLAESPLPSEPTNPWLKWSLHRPRGFIAAFIAFVVFMAGIAFIAFVVFTSGIAADFDNEIGVQFTGVHSADFGMVLL